MSTTTTRAPKRRIEKIRNRINFTATDSATPIALHTAEDSKTLVRMIVDLEIQHAITAVADLHIVLQHAPAGVNIVTPTISQALDVPAVNNLLLEKSSRDLTRAALSDTQIIVWEVDSKAMRKLKEGDLITLSSITDVSAAFSITGHITLFFKE